MPYIGNSAESPQFFSLTMLKGTMALGNSVFFMRFATQNISDYCLFRTYIIKNNQIEQAGCLVNYFISNSSKMWYF